MLPSLSMTVIKTLRASVTPPVAIVNGSSNGIVSGSTCTDWMVVCDICCSLSFLSLPPEGIADAAHGLNQFRVRRVLLNVLASPANMHIAGARIAHVVAAPDVVQQLIPRQD